ncbi:ATP-dependent helicase HrpB [Natronoflexus pectinivorans]|uniref:ATP-dependent helicase HrpB n=1 Tax=Natronoflexus pectinivorans TaxID=682526 RepID=A0A4V2RWS6_9BACT|nr:ATP-dependent helicase HrpB [Natronoflexus pectinivorans]TCO09801.1 ATP-dependent helicase HrpB [Natronoflexus pectinivorans]
MSNQLFQQELQKLPIHEIIPKVKEELNKQNTLILHAPPGAGKSTMLPLTLLKEKWLDGKKIIMLEPRRLAARSIAARMANLLGENIGETVGYRIRFENKTSEKTRIEVVTEGILTRMLQSDNSLENAGLVIFDEFHERSLFADVALAICREAQQIIRPDLRLVVMSATLNTEILTKTLNAPLVSAHGRQFPVETIYTGVRDLTLLPQQTAITVSEAIQKEKGDVLVFLPGEAEIRQCEEILKKSLPEINIHPLYGQMPFAAQMAAIMPNKHGKRKVVIATSIAETSLTIEGISVVVDSGYGRTMQFNPGNGLSRLTTVEITRDTADQRAGRAGRLGPGKCYRMWSKADQNRMKAHRIPEIEESDLSSLVLDLAQWGNLNINELTWLTPPPRSHLQQAIDTLTQLGALEDEKITSHGKKMAALPCHPRIAHMLLKAEEENQLPLATDLAAVLEERDPLGRDSGIDINLRIEALRRYRSQKSGNRIWSRIDKVASSYRKMFNIDASNSLFDPYDTGLLLVFAYPERIASARSGNNARFQLSNGTYAIASHTDDLTHEPWLVVASMDARQGDGKIFLAAPVNPKDLASMVKTTETVTWDVRKGGLVASKDLKIGSITLQSVPLENPDSELILKAIVEALKKEGERLLDFNPDVQQWQNRVLSLKIWNPQENWPDVSTSALLKNCENWIEPYLINIKRNDDLAKIDLINALHYHLEPEKQKELERLAPRTIQVPSGSEIKLKYNSDGSPPVLSVRLQKMFGLAETPKVNNGNTKVLLHLLSPGFKPVQVTSDLKSFWNNAYFEVKKELKSRYPKHVWPDDPWNEKATRGVKRKK